MFGHRDPETNPKINHKKTANFNNIADNQ